MGCRWASNCTPWEGAAKDLDGTLRPSPPSLRSVELAVSSPHGLRAESALDKAGWVCERACPCRGAWTAISPSGRRPQRPGRQDGRDAVAYIPERLGLRPAGARMASATCAGVQPDDGGRLEDERRVPHQKAAGCGAPASVSAITTTNGFAPLGDTLLESCWRHRCAPGHVRDGRRLGGGGRRRPLALLTKHKAGSASCT